MKNKPNVEDSENLLLLSQFLARPCRWDMRFLKNFMLVLGIESLATQVLVIFVIHTRGNPLASRPHPLLATTSLLIVILAMALPFTPIAAMLGFVRPPASLFVILIATTLAYLLLAQLGKQTFYRIYTFKPQPP